MRNPSRPWTFRLFFIFFPLSGFSFVFEDSKIYFEQGEFEMIYTLYDKMKHFLKRKNHIADYTSVSYDKLLNYTMKFIKGYGK